MEAREPEDGNEQQRDDCDEDNRHQDWGLCEVVLLVQDVDQAEDKDRCHVHGERDQEHEEVTVVASADAVVHPWAVVVKYLIRQRMKLSLEF